MYHSGMNDPGKSPKNPAPPSRSERELEEARNREGLAEREAEKTLERAEQLEKKSRKLGERISKKGKSNPG
jgi:hypothetical protein